MACGLISSRGFARRGSATTARAPEAPSGFPADAGQVPPDGSRRSLLQRSAPPAADRQVGRRGHRGAPRFVSA
eukprot:2526248-Lingulodinium_polyedra.AAC.1